MARASVPASGGTFEYSALDDAFNDIRLVSLEATLGTLPDGKKVPQCDLRHVSMHSRPTYTALSYVWGHPEDARTILIGGKPKQVTANLYTFLTQTVDELRAVDTESAALWIDALSINQRDDDEKSHQVQAMGNIFRNATTVRIWLGESFDRCDLVFQFIEEVSESFSNENPWTLLETLEAASASEERFLQICSRAAELAMPLSILIGNPWW